jgi:hypothetical protein
MDVNEDRAMNWQQANQRYLAAALARVAAYLQRHAGKEPLPAVEFDQTLAHALSTPAALERLCTVFGLSTFERDLLLLCAGAELDATFPALCGAASGGLPTASPTFGLALAALPDAHWSALAPAAPLRHWRLIEVGEGPTLVASPLRIDERVLHFLAGVHSLDERLAEWLQPAAAPEPLPASQLDLVDRVVALLLSEQGALPIVYLCGVDGVMLRNLAAAVCERLDLALYRGQPTELPAALAERNLLARLWDREAALVGSVLLLEADEPTGFQRSLTFADRLLAPVMLAGPTLPVVLTGRPLIRVPVEKPAPVEQETLWRRALGQRGQSLNGYVPNLVAHFNLTPPLIEAAAGSALTQTPATAPPGQLKQKLWQACRDQSRPRLDDLAQRMGSAATWADLVLPEAERQTLGEIVAHVRRRYQVYEHWGFAARSPRGLGTSVVFAGPSGTGKTLAAEVIANTLQLDLYRIDLSAVVSKYIGETEKNLHRIFDAAEYGGAILLFDEADALFGKRSEVKDSHDRYANIEVSFLLQQMEAYRGLAILTTNMLHAFDSAFLRRVRFLVHFPFPTAAQRRAIWARIFPTATPTAGLDLDKLARLDLTGGHIRTIALNAAFLAADQGEPVQMHHLLRAAQSEYSKLERPLLTAETQDWITHGSS